MADFDIKIKVTKEGDAIPRTTQELEKLSATGEKASERTSRLDSVFRRAASGLNKLGNEIPIVGYALNALKNPFTIVAAVVVYGIGKFQEYSKALGEMVSNSDHAAKRIKVSADSYSNAAQAVAAMAAAMKDLRDFTKNVTDNLELNITKIGEQFAATEKLLEAEAELAKARIDRDEPDPVKGAQGKAAIDDRLAETRLGLRGEKGQQAALVEQQRLRERQLQIDAIAEVPSRESLVASVSAFESSRAELEAAKNDQRQSFGKAELLRRFVREGNSPEFFKTFAPSDIQTLQDMGLVSGVGGSLKDGLLGGELKTNDALGAELLPGAEAAQARARDRLGRAQSSFNSSRGSLPAGIAQIADIDPFLNKAESQAADVASESYRREEALALRRESLLRGQQTDVSVGRLQVQTTRTRGETDVMRAVKEALVDQAEAFAEAVREQTNMIRATNQRAKNHSQDIGR